LKLYELPNFTYFTIKGDKSKSEFFLDHIDGMYSVCFNRFQDTVHINANTEVEANEN
jgi:hypothetical protein